MGSPHHMLPARIEQRTVYPVRVIYRVDDAQHIFDRLLNVRNDLGLLVEEYDPKQLGNFPQAFSHIGLINSAVNLTRAIAPMHQRTDTEPSEVAA
jgi:hypothetical protein